jgi:2-oxoglutarate dehydrogenase E2 component (dihydrolipoamide succinyltransferase)
MKIEIKMPKMGESIVEGTVGTILKQTGAIVKAEEEILEIETDKVNQAITAPASGKLELKVKQGDVVKIDQVIATIETEGVAETPKAIEPKQEAAPITTSSRKKADEYLSELNTPPVVVPTPAIPERSSSRETRKKMTKLRKVIAERLVKVKNETAMLTTFNEVDMGNVIRLREENQEAFQKKHGVKLGFMSFFVKAVVAALQQFPEINARIEGDDIVYQNFYDIGIAVGTDKGLFVPVVRNADQLSYADIEKALKTYAEKAKMGTISVDEMQGGTFTITNGGVYGSMLSTPILNPPQSGILGMHNIIKRAVVVNDEVVIRPMMYLALSYDHRIVDGKESIGFLMQVKKILEEPTRLLLDL